MTLIKQSNHQTIKQFFLLLALAGLSASLSAVEIGPDWQIAIPEKPEEVVVCASLEDAAKEIQRDLKEACGFELPIVKASAAKSPAIRLGETFAKKAGLLPNDLSTFDNVIAEKDGDIYLFGADRPSQKGLGPTHWWLSAIPTARAAVRFLRTRAGVWFLMPGETGVEVTNRGKVTLPGGTFDREHPNHQWSSARTFNMMYGMSNYLLGRGTVKTYGGHSYQDAVPPSLGKEHPEYFGLFAGKRIVRENQSALCISNPEVRDLMVKELCRRFDEGASVCQLGQQDGFTGCECDKCAAYGGAVAKDDWGEKLWIFHRDIAERVAKLRPGKIVHIISYGPTTEPPHSFREFPENVMIELCYYSEDAFRQWSAYRVPHGFSVYTYIWGTYNLPGFTPKCSLSYAVDCAECFNRNHVRALFRCGYGELFGLEGPCYFVFNSLLENPKADVRKLMTDYCRVAFGPAAADMLAFYERLDTQLQLFCLTRKGWEGQTTTGAGHYAETYKGNSLAMLAATYPPDVVKALEDRLVRSERAPGLSEKAKRRLALVRMEWNYTKNLARIATLYNAYRLAPTRGTFAPLAEALRERTKIVGDLYPDPKQRVSRKIEGWPDYQPFGGGSRAELLSNGLLSARLLAPLTWDVDFMESKGFLPGGDPLRAKVVRAKTRPSLDGDATKGEWAHAAWQDMNGSQLQKIPYSARMKLLYDDEALYCAIESDLKDDVPVKTFGRDGNTFCDESVDLLVAPFGNRDRYFHFIAGPSKGELFDQAFGLITDPLNPKFKSGDADWNAKTVEVGNRRANGRWTCVLRVPYADLGAAKPASGDRWYLNTGRTWDFARRRQSGFKDEYALWSPNLENRSFIAPDAMGEIVFE